MLGLRRRIGTLDILLTGMAFPIRSLLLTRLVAVILAVKHRLLVHAGIPLS